jgi:hypothetical protein
MTKEKRRPFQSGADLLGGGQHRYQNPPEIATDTIPPILARHYYRHDEIDAEHSLAWTRWLAAEAARWLSARGAA